MDLSPATPNGDPMHNETTRTILRLERERKQLKRAIARYRKIMHRYETWLKDRVLGGKRVPPR